MRLAPQGRTALRRRPIARIGQAAALAAAGGAALVAAPSDAGDRELTGTLSQTFLGDTNLQVGNRSNQDEDGGALGSRSKLTLHYKDVAPLSSFTFDGDVNYDAYTGDANDNLAGLFPNLKSRYVTGRSTEQFSLSLFANATPVDYYSFGNGFSFFDPDGEPTPIDPTDPDAGPGNPTATSEEAIRVSYGAGANYSRQVNSTDSLSLGFSVRRVDFIDGTAAQTPSNQFTLTSGWNRQITSRHNVGLTYEGDVIQAEGVQDTRTVTFSLLPSFAYARTPGQVYSLSLGPQYTVTHQNQVLAGGAVVPDASYQTGLRAAAGLDYAYDAAKLSLSLRQDVTTNDDGSPVNRTSLTGSFSERYAGGVTLSARLTGAFETPLDDSDSLARETTRVYSTGTFKQDVDSLTAIDFSAGAGFDDDGVDQDLTLSAGAGYTYKLTEKTGLRLAYDYRHPMGDASDEDDSHRVSVTLTRDFTLLP